ncbi:MAG: ribosome biogenesis factor YjgA [Gammaproteobacteria bacterium]|nr:ribosome biogenesis factor YjgA [Gammaproteobacteria bacterium]
MSNYLPEDDGVISKSALKREHHEIRALGEELIGLGDRQLKRLDLEESVRDAVLEGRRLKHGALQRHLRHLANLLTEIDHAAIRETLAAMREPHRVDVRLLHEVERWRDALVAGDDGCMAEIQTRCPGIDMTQLRSLTAEARTDKATGRPPKYARQLFSFLRLARQASVAAVATQDQ